MSLTLIIGPMKSRKTLELISRIAPYEFTKKQVVVVQSDKNVRDHMVKSRQGVMLKAIRLSSLHDVIATADIIAVDEINMFTKADIVAVKKWLIAGKDVVLSGLDLDYRGKLVPVIKHVLELKPDAIIDKIAVCDVCQHFKAKFSQILFKGEPVLEGLPIITPEDGTYEYQARCRRCFQQAEV